MYIQDIRRQSLQMFVAAAVLACATTVALVAQEPAKPIPDRQQPVASDPKTEAPEYTSTSRMIGADVILAANTEALEKAQRSGEEPKHPKATVKEWIVDSRTGALRYAVLSIGGFLGINDKTVLVPCEELVWNNSMERFSLGWTKDQLKAKPEFDLDKACASGLDQCCASPHEVGKSEPRDATGDANRGTAEASAKRSGKIDGTSFVYPASRLCRASDLASVHVYTGDAAFGKVKDLIVDRKRGCVVLAVVNHDSTLGLGGKDYLIPLAQLTPCVKDGDKKLLCTTARSKEQLETSVPFEKPKNGVVDPAAAQNALSSVKTEEQDRDARREEGKR